MIACSKFCRSRGPYPQREPNVRLTQSEGGTCTYGYKAVGEANCVRTTTLFRYPAYPIALRCMSYISMLLELQSGFSSSQGGLDATTADTRNAAMRRTCTSPTMALLLLAVGAAAQNSTGSTPPPPLGGGGGGISVGVLVGILVGVLVFIILKTGIPRLVVACTP